MDDVTNNSVTIRFTSATYVVSLAYNSEMLYSMWVRDRCSSILVDSTSVTFREAAEECIAHWCRMAATPGAYDDE